MIPNDSGRPYLRHLAKHLDGCGAVARLHELLSLERPRASSFAVAGDPPEMESVWFARRELRGQTTGYLLDVGLAWNRSREESARRLGGTSALPSLGMELRYALITASVNDVAGTVPAPLAVAMIREGLWSQARGLDLARRAPDPVTASRMLNGLIPTLTRREALEEARDVVDGIADNACRHAGYRALCLRWLALGYESEALAIAGRLPAGSMQAETLSTIVDTVVRSGRIDQALEIASRIPIASVRAVTLEHVAEHRAVAIQASVRREALAATSEIADLSDRVECLCKLTAAWPREQREQAALEVLPLARDLPESRLRADCLLRLLEALPKRLHAKVAQNLLSCATPHLEAQQWARLAAHLAPDSRLEAYGRALVLVGTMADREQRVRELSGLLPLLPQDLRRKTWCAAVAAVTKIENSESRSINLARLAAMAPTPLEPATWTQKLTGGLGVRGVARAVLTLFPVVWISLGSIPKSLRRSPWQRWATLLKTSLRAFWSGWTNDHLRALTTAAGMERALRKALVTCAVPSAGNTKGRGLIRLAHHLPRRLQEKAFRQALTAVLLESNPESLATLLAELSPTLPDRLWRLALQRGRRLSDPHSRDLAVATLLLQRGSDLRSHRILELTRSLTRQELRREVLEVLASHLLGAELPAAVQMARALGDSDQRASATADLALLSGLPESLEAAAGSIEEPGIRITTWLNAAHRWAQADSAPGGKAKALRALEQALETARSVPELGFKLTMLEAVAESCPAGALQDRARKAAAEAASAFHRELIETPEGMPNWVMASVLPESLETDVLNRALRDNRKRRDDASRTQELILMASLLPEPRRREALREALQLALGLTDEHYAKNRLVQDLVPQLKAFGWASEALNAIRDLSDLASRDRLFAELALELASDHPGQALVAASAIRGPWPRARVQAQLASRLPAQQSAEACQAALGTILEIAQEGLRIAAWLGLSRSLAAEEKAKVLGIALSAARDIPSPSARCIALMRVAETLTDCERRRVLNEAWRAARRAVDPDRRVRTLMRLAFRLQEPTRDRALAAARALVEANDPPALRTATLRGLALRCTVRGRFPEALIATRQIASPAPRGRLLARLAVRFPPGLKDEALNAALRDTVRIEPRGERAFALVALAARLPESLRQEAVRMASAAIRELKESPRGEFEASIERLVDRFLGLDQWAEARILATSLATSVRRRKLLQRAQAAEIEAFQGELLAVLVNSLESAGQAVVAARLRKAAADDPHFAGSTTTSILQQLPRADLYAAWTAILTFLSPRGRRALLRHPWLLASLVVSLGGTDAASEAQRAINDVGRWWP